MKRHIQKPGIRRWSGTDLVELQSEPLKAIDGFFGSYGPMILSGCKVNNGVIAPGLVVLFDNDSNNPGYRIASFDGCTPVSFPVYLKLEKVEMKRAYQNPAESSIGFEYKAIVSDTPTDLVIKPTGNRTFIEAIQDEKHLFVTDTEKELWNNKLSTERNPLSVFDGFYSSGNVIQGEAPKDKLGTIVYLSSMRTFVKRVNPRIGYIVTLPSYYTKWEGYEEFVEEYPEDMGGGTTPYMNKLYLFDGVLYYWAGDELLKVGAMEWEDYNALINRPSINGVSLKGNVSLEALGIRQESHPFVEIIDDEITPLSASHSGSNGEVVFMSYANCFALRVKNMLGAASYFNNWMGADDYVEFYIPPFGDGTTVSRPPSGRIYSIGQIMYYWDGTGLKVYGYYGASTGDKMPSMVGFDGVVEGVTLEATSIMAKGPVLFAKNSRYPMTLQSLNIFVLYSGGKYYNNFGEREKYSDDTLVPYSDRLYKSGGSLYVWDGTTLAEVGKSGMLAMEFGSLLTRPSSTAAQVQAVTGKNFDTLYNTVKKDGKLSDNTTGETAQLTACCKLVSNIKQVEISFPFEYHAEGTLSKLTIKADYTATARHFRMTAAL